MIYGTLWGGMADHPISLLNLRLFWLLFDGSVSAKSKENFVLECLHWFGPKRLKYMDKQYKEY